MALDLWYLSVNEHVLNNYWMRFCDIQNNQGRGRGYRLSLITLTETLVILDITKTESNDCFIIHWTNSFFLASTENVCFQSLCQLFLFLRFAESSLSQVISNSSLATFVDLFVFCILVFNYFFDDLLGQRSKPGSHVFTSSLTASKTRRANLTWLPLEVMHRGHTWHDYSWPWVSFTW